MKVISIKRLLRNQKGLSLTEVAIALAVFGVVGASIMSGLNTSNKTMVSAQEITVAESLNRTIIEYVKRSPYDATNFPTAYYDSDALSEGVTGAVDYPTLLGLDGDPYYGDFTVDINIERLDPQADGTADDDGMQKITTEVYYQGKLALATEAYKANR